MSVRHSVITFSLFYSALLAELLKVVLTIVGGLAANLIGALVGALHLVGCLDVFVGLKFTAVLAVLGL